ncbi:hypothetical protein KGQ19_26830 [Catenulispora sp. NL8]|uniref:Integral membrane protein n=1 Tax=Catenulispora pinistramenti TaxID=2705254 RepID=A0ABS5KWP2_9ACTN|nr:hypothetical protein [Catenulispora pinistramenti]MBS2550491.1 hypothetical protein [Catenulispora pinistramenti]
MSAMSAEPAEAIPAAPVLVKVRTAAAKMVARPRRRRPPTRLGQFLTGVAAVYTAYTGWWALCLLHGPARVLTAGAVSTGYLAFSALWRRGWLG